MATRAIRAKCSEKQQVQAFVQHVRGSVRNHRFTKWQTYDTHMFEFDGSSDLFFHKFCVKKLNYYQYLTAYHIW